MLKFSQHKNKTLNESLPEVSFTSHDQTDTASSAYFN